MRDENADDQQAEQAARARRAASLAKMRARFGDVADRFRRVYGLRLPQTMAVFAAFWDSLDDIEREGMDYAGLSPGGITAYFEDGGLDLVARDGLDERLESRFRHDPPEFVTVMYGDSDGHHFGLWYDDSVDLPEIVVSSYARDDPTVMTQHNTTPLNEVSERLENLGRELGVIEDEFEDLGDSEDEIDESDFEESELAVRYAFQAAEAFFDADQQALEADGDAEETDVERVEVWGCAPGLILPAGTADPFPGTTPLERYKAYRERTEDVPAWIAYARTELDAGRPAAALVLGHELRFEDLEEYRADGWELLIAAYRALGRNAQAGIATVHRDNLDLRSVGVLTSGGLEAD